MNKRTMTVLAVGVALLLTLQFFVPVFTGNAELDLPERIRTFFSEIFGGKEEPKLPDIIELDKQPDGHNETPMQTLGEDDRVEAPPEEPEDTNPQPPTEHTGENELPMDRF